MTVLRGIQLLSLVVFRYLRVVHRNFAFLDLLVLTYVFAKFIFEMRYSIFFIHV